MSHTLRGSKKTPREVKVFQNFESGKFGFIRSTRSMGSFMKRPFWFPSFYLLPAFGPFFHFCQKRDRERVHLYYTKKDKERDHPNNGYGSDCFTGLGQDFGNVSSQV